MAITPQTLHLIALVQLSTACFLLLPFFLSACIRLHLTCNYWGWSRDKQNHSDLREEARKSTCWKTSSHQQKCTCWSKALYDRWCCFSLDEVEMFNSIKTCSEQFHAHVRVLRFYHIDILNVNLQWFKYSLNKVLKHFFSQVSTGFRMDTSIYFMVVVC